MKKLLLTMLCIIALGQQSNACTYYDPDTRFYALFAQELIQEPAYNPFLLTYSNPLYEFENENQPFVKDKNIVAWQQYFGNELTYEETNALLKIIRLKHLKNWKNGKLSHVLSKQMGANFYNKYKEGFDYLIVAKTLEPYMRITVKSDWYSEEDTKTAANLPYDKTLKLLKSAYNEANNSEIKLRYGFQIVRFLHYTRNYEDAVNAFNTYIDGHATTSPIYWHAVNQMAGALRGLGRVDKANYLFLKVFQNSNTLKENAYRSIRLNYDYDLNNLLHYTKTTEEKNLVYFLLAYKNYVNPIPLMQKMMQNDANSKILKVLTARAINQLERDYLPVNHYCWDDQCNLKKHKLLPVAEHHYRNSTNFNNYIYDLKDMLAQISQKSNDAYWDLTLAHLDFLLKDYDASNNILNHIKTNNPVYQNQIAKAKMLNDIVSQKTIDANFEQHLMEDYAELFQTEEGDQWSKPSTLDFVKDILANRYFVQKDYAKAFLLNNDLYQIQYNPQIGLVRKLDKFYQKSNKNAFESYLTNSSRIGFESKAKLRSFFNLIYGDYAMRDGEFNKAIDYYSNVTAFDQIPRFYWGGEFYEIPAGEYDGFRHISDGIFGYNVIECFECPEYKTLNKTSHSFDFIPKGEMTKLELAKIMQRLENIGKTPSTEAAKANQLIGNVLYNTSALGYFRELFVLDINNANSLKYQYGNVPSFEFNYKNYEYKAFAEKGNYDVVIAYYKKALQQSNDKEQEARILFQMASAEQGKYYIWAGNQKVGAHWNDDDYDKKHSAFIQRLRDTKESDFRNYFDQLSNRYANTNTVAQLRRSCSYFNHYMIKN